MTKRDMFKEMTNKLYDADFRYGSKINNRTVEQFENALQRYRENLAEAVLRGYAIGHYGRKIYGIDEMIICVQSSAIRML